LRGEQRMDLCINARAGEARRGVGLCHAGTHLAGTTGMTQTYG
jgi:hypothetical protein